MLLSRIPTLLDPLELDELTRAALADLSLAADRDYYDAVQDELDCQVYYELLLLPAPAGVAITFDSLSQLVRETHTTRLTYRPARHVYPWVDLHPDGHIHSIYSGLPYDAADFILADAQTDRDRADWLTDLLPDFDQADEQRLADALDSLEDALPYNCEHVVPQSWFAKQEPMRGDLHHLFACESRCNSFRGNRAYFDFPDFPAGLLDAEQDDCGKLAGNQFEPGSGKGVVARAVLYFLMRYPGEINANQAEFEAERLPILLDWHQSFPPDEYERHRNMAIFALQGNRNPFIDFPDWVAQIDFHLGLGDENDEQQ